MLGLRDFINTSISPNLEFGDILQDLKLIISPFNLKKGDFVSRVESWFKYNFQAKHAYCFSSAREAEYALLKALGVRKGDEVLVQAFTCIAAVNPILWLHAKPVYVDIDSKTLSIDPFDLKKKITNKTKAVIIQHTFGIPSNIEEIKKIIQDRKVFLIEDCAHVIGGIYHGKKLGTFGNAAFFSFGRDKAVSSVFGGIVILNNKFISQRIKKIREMSPFPSYLWIYQQLAHPICTFLVISGFRIHPLIGKLLLYVFKKIKLISVPILPEERSTYIKSYKTRKYPNALALLCFSQLQKLNKFNKTRLDLYKFYRHELNDLKSKLKFPETEAYYLRIPVLTIDKEKIINFSKEYSVYFGDWYSHVIDPKDINLEKIFYKKNSCKVAEKTARNILNLPCYPRMNKNDAARVINVLKLYYASQKFSSKGKLVLNEQI